MVLARHVETCESLEEVGARNNAVIVENVLLLRQVHPIMIVLFHQLSLTLQMKHLTVPQSCLFQVCYAKQTRMHAETHSAHKPYTCTYM